MTSNKEVNIRIGRLIALATVILAALAMTFVQCRNKESQQKTTSSKQSELTSSAATSQPGWRDVENLPETVLDAAHRAKAQELMDKGTMYLIRQREGDGSWSVNKSSSTPAITAMVLKALVQHPSYGPQHPAVKKGFEVLLTFKQPDGGVYVPEEGGSSYTSAVALMALSAARNPEYAGHIRDLVAYLKGLQIVPGAESADGTPIKEDDPRVGGVSYGKGTGRPDLSNVGMWAESLHEAGVPADDPAMQRAVAFVSRLQNHSETNAMAWAKDGENDGGFIYTTPSDGPGAAQGAKSYGSMTYTGFKSLLYAGVNRNDSRVQSAYKWIRQYWQLDRNPNMPEAKSLAGIFYYYHVFSKALRVWGEPVITDSKGIKHNWRHELIDCLAGNVREDGSWLNRSDRWMEGFPILATSFAVLALEEAVKPSSNEKPKEEAGKRP